MGKQTDCERENMTAPTAEQMDAPDGATTAFRTARSKNNSKGAKDPVQAVGFIFAIAACAVTLLPLPVLLAVAFSKNWVDGLSGGVTGQWLSQAWQRMDQSVFISLQVALIVMIVDLLVALPAARFITRHSFPGRGLLQSVSTLPIAIPGIAVGLALILSYPVLRPSGWLMVAGHVLYTLPFLLSALIPAMNSERLKEQELVASSLGMGTAKIFFSVTLPAVRRALIGGLVMVVTMSLGEFNVTFFLFTPSAQPMPVFLFDTYITGRIELAAAQTAIFLAMVIPPAIVLEKFQVQKGGAV